MTAILNTLRLMVVAIEISAAKWIVASTSGVARKLRRKSLDQESVGARIDALILEIETARGRLCGESRSRPRILTISVQQADHASGGRDAVTDLGLRL